MSARNQLVFLLFVSLLYLCAFAQEEQSHDYFTFAQDFYSGCGNVKRCVGFYNHTCIQAKNCKGGFTVFQNRNSLIVSSYNYKDLGKYEDNYEYLFVFLFDPFMEQSRILFSPTMTTRFACKPYLNATDGGLAIFRYKKPRNLQNTILYKLYNTTKIQEQGEGWEKYTFLTARIGTEWDNICYNISSNMNKPIVHQGLEFQSSFKFNNKLYYMGGIAGNYLLMTPEIFRKWQESSSYLYQNSKSVFFTNFDTTKLEKESIIPDFEREQEYESTTQATMRTTTTKANKEKHPFSSSRSNSQSFQINTSFKYFISTLILYLMNSCLFRI